jgi:uncharacterized protein YraI
MKKFLILCLVLFGAAACGLPPRTVTPAPPPQMQTAAALTIEAVLSSTPLATATNAPQNTAPAVTTTVSASSTPSPGQAMLTVEDVTNCRSGPGADYERITQIQAGQQVNIVGSYPSYWLVQTEAGICWIAMEFSTPTGDVAGVPTISGAPTPLAGAPKSPSLQRYDYFCNSQTNQVDLSLRWTDKSANESGYRIYINDKVFVELPADSAKYDLSFDMEAGETASFKIEAFNQAGAASTSAISISC